MKKIFRLTEGELRNFIQASAQRVIDDIRMNESIDRAVANSINEVITEIGDTPIGQYHLGRLSGRKMYQDKDDDFDKITKYAHDKSYEPRYFDYEPRLKTAYDDGYKDQYALEKAQDDLQFHSGFWRNRNKYEYGM